MSTQANITSVDALESFRSELIRYIETARIALEDMTGDARRTRTWLDFDRTQYWTGLHKRALKKLHQAEQELYSANLTNPHASNAIQKLAVARAERAVAEIEAKLHVIKRWRQVYDNRTGPLVQQLEPMFAQVSQQLPKAAHTLGELIKALQQYAEKSAPPPAS